MKKLFFVFTCVISLCLVSLLVSAKYYKRSDALGEELSKETSIVREFWKNSLTRKKIDYLTILSPKAFFNEKSRCLTTTKKNSRDKIKSTSKEILPAIVSDKNTDIFIKNLKEFSKGIRKGKYKLLNVVRYRQWQNEAIVQVTYSSTKHQNIDKSMFLYLSREEKAWKIFLNTKDLDAFNSEYARYECN